MFGSKRKTMKQRVTELEESVLKLRNESFKIKEEKRPTILKDFSTKIKPALENIGVFVKGKVVTQKGNMVYNQYVFFDFAISFKANAEKSIMSDAMDSVFKNLASNNKGFTFHGVSKEKDDKTSNGMINRSISVKFEHVS